jgi:hypothetical protein
LGEKISAYRILGRKARMKETTRKAKMAVDGNYYSES